MVEEEWAGAEDGAQQQQEFEVEDILRYRRNDAGEEYFLVKWIGFPETEATWEPLAHMNDNCRELIAKARAFFAWRRPAAAAAEAEAPAEEEGADAAMEEEAEEAEKEAEEEPPPVAPEPAPKKPVPPRQPPSQGQLAAAQQRQRRAERAEEPQPMDTGANSATAAQKRPGDAAAGSQVGQKRARLQPPTGPPPGQQDSTSSQAKAQRPANGRAPGGPVPPPNPPARVTSKDAQPTPPKSMAVDKVEKPRKDGPVVCKVCNGAQQPTEGLKGPLPADFVCPPCRLERVDEFHPPVGAGLLRHSYAHCSSTFSLSFQAQAGQWRKQQWAVHLRAVHTSSHELGGPAWPHRVQGKLNGRQCVAIDPPKHLHVRREQCYNLTPLLRQGVNNLELKFFPRPDKPREEPDEGYCVGVVLTRPRSVASIIARIRTRSTETTSSGRQRVERLLQQAATRESQEDECEVTGNFGRTLKPVCPVSLCPIEEAAIGRMCNHIQVFDLQSYIAVNQRMRSLDKRWTCPVCGLPLRPDDVILDPFAQGILDTLRGDEAEVEEVVFNDDCTWSTVSAVKDEKEKAPAPSGGGDEEGGEGAGAELIDLEDSE